MSRLTLSLALCGAICTHSAAAASTQQKACLDDYRYLFRAEGNAEGPKAPRLSDVLSGRVKEDAFGRPVPAFLKPELPGARPDVDSIVRTNHEYNRLIFKLADDTSATIIDGVFATGDGQAEDELTQILRRYPDLKVERSHSANPDFLTAVRYCAALNTNSYHADLTSYYQIKLEPEQRDIAKLLLRELATVKAVESAWMRGVPSTTTADIAPTTPLFSAQQRYWDAAPVGVGLRAAWSAYPYTKATGMRFADVEFTWTTIHEDFPAVTDLSTGPPEFAANPGHGTAVLGIMAAQHIVPSYGSYGVDGGVAEAIPHVFNDYHNVVNLAYYLWPGDSVLLELAHSFDTKGSCAFNGPGAIPLERDNQIFDDIKALTSNGIAVFEPAGNGAVDLDAGCFAGELSRGGRDSGAIFVAAQEMNPINCTGTPMPAGFAAAFTGFGSRIDANGWGRCVTTSGQNGDLFDGNSDIRQFYTRLFNGTSSATPIVASVGMALQGYQTARNTPYSPIRLRWLLQRFGTAMTSGNFIAKQPDLGQALTWLNADDDGDGTANGDEVALNLWRSRPSDFNGDAFSDIPWWHNTSGAVYRHLMNGLSIASGAQSYSEPNTTYRIIGFADFDGDGISDMLWRGSTGNIYIQYYNINGYPAPVVPIAYNEPNSNWKVIATPDLNGDGKADLLWWNSSSGEVYAILLNGNAILQQGGVVTVADTNWKIFGVGSFSGGAPQNQLIWRHSISGDVSMMTVTTNGIAFSETSSVFYNDPTAAWKIIATADFDGDGRSDLLWRNGATGEIYMMLMSGTTILTHGQLYLEPNLAWKVVAVADYNNDGKADILWRNDSTGQVYMMLLNAIGITSQAVVHNEPSQSWRLLGFWEFGVNNGVYP